MPAQVRRNGIAADRRFRCAAPETRRRRPDGRIRQRTCALAAAVVLASPAVAAPLPEANAKGAFGLYPASGFRLATGATCGTCAAIRQARWYFRDEWIAVPRDGLPVAGFTPGVSASEDVRQWAAARAPDARIDFPPLVWVAAPFVARGGRLAVDGATLAVNGATLPVRPVAKIPLNRSYYDASSIAWLAAHPLTVRGTLEGDHFVMRTVWPEDFGVGPAAPALRELPAAPSPALALRALMRELPQGGARAPYAASTLWQRAGVLGDWRGKPVLAFMVNGAQGDDDEAHGGHFALVTGRVNEDGTIGDWLVNNFYSLDIESEKGIIAAPVPLDNYLGDLNAGQNWYRPTYMVVAVLRDERAAALVQSAINRVFNQFYRHQLVYYHPTENCASISVDALRALGWPLRVRGPSGRFLAWASFPWVLATERSVGKAKVAFDYLHADQTRLLPAAALEEAFTGLLTLGQGSLPDGAGPLARMLADDLEALAYVRIPQFPSSRKFGDAPAVTTAEYRARVPSDPALVQIVPVPSRPFPAELRDADLLTPPRHPSDIAMIVWSIVTVAGIPFLLWRAWRWRRTRRRPAVTP